MKEIPIDPITGPPYSPRERLRKIILPHSVIARIKAYKEFLKGEKELRFLKFLVNREKNSIDVGANMGVYTYYLSKYSRHVYAFEPNPKMLRYLRTWKKPNITIYDLGLSNNSGEAVLRIPVAKGSFSNQHGTLSEAVPLDAYGVMPIKTAKLDDFEFHDIGFIKIDVEGHEFEVLEGARNTIAENKPVMLIEIEERYNGIKIEDALKKVEDMGYIGMAIIPGKGLQYLDCFDPEKNHREFLNSGNKNHYIFNFIFMPINSGDRHSVLPRI